MDSFESFRHGMRDTATLLRLAADDIDALADNLEVLTVREVVSRITETTEKTVRALDHAFDLPEGS